MAKNAGRAGSPRAALVPPLIAAPAAKAGKKASPPAQSPIALLFQRLPPFFFLGREASAILYGSILLFTLFIAAAFFAAPKVSVDSQLYEQPLHKNAVLQLKPGEAYRYLYYGPEGVQQLSYEVRSSPSCSGVLVAEKESGDAACLLPDGKEAGFQNLGNLGYGNHSLLLTAPWMLAASENFSWEVKSVVAVGSSNFSIPILFRSEPPASVAGRRAYVIWAAGPGGAPAGIRFLIDAEKRVLLKLEAGNYSARLVAAPFPLSWNGSGG